MAANTTINLLNVRVHSSVTRMHATCVLEWGGDVALNNRFVGAHV